MGNNYLTKITVNTSLFNTTYGVQVVDWFSPYN